MKRILSVLLILICFGTADLFAKNKAAEDAENWEEEISFKVPGNAFFSIGASTGFIPGNEYKSYIMKDLSFYFNPYLAGGGQISLGKHFSLNGFGTWNVMSFAKGISFCANWFKGCQTWAGSASLLLNVTLLGFPYFIGVIPALYFSICGLDLHGYFYYHPFYNDFLDTKIGIGLSNEPSQDYDYCGFAIFLHPFASVRMECDIFKGAFIATAFASYSYDLWHFIKVEDVSSEKYFDKITIGIQIGFKNK